MVGSLVGRGPLHIAIAADHNGVAVKGRLTQWLVDRGHRVDDCGTHGTAPVDYPPLCARVCRMVTGGAAHIAIIIGGSGQGEVIACNKIRGIRAGLCDTTSMAEVARGNNDANVLVLGAKITDAETMQHILDVWLATPFQGGDHQRRLDMIAALEHAEAVPG